MQRSMIVLILLHHSIFAHIADLVFEVFHDLPILSWVQQMLKFCNQIVGFARVKWGFLLWVVQAADLKEHFQECLVFGFLVDIDVKQDLQRFETLCEFAHSHVV